MAVGRNRPLLAASGLIDDGPNSTLSRPTISELALEGEANAWLARESSHACHMGQAREVSGQNLRAPGRSRHSRFGGSSRNQLQPLALHYLVAPPGTCFLTNRPGVATRSTR